MFAGFFRAGFGVEADHRQQLFGVGEHLLLDHQAQLLVTCPARVFALVVGARSQHEVDDLVAEVFWVGDASWLLNFVQFVVERRAVKHLAGVGVAVFVVLDPVVGIGDVTVENVLPVFAVTLQVGGLNLFADELGVTWRQMLLDETGEAGFKLGGELLAFNLLLQHIHQVHRVGGDLGAVEVEHFGEDLEGETRGDAAHAFVHACHVTVLLVTLGARVGVFEALAVVDLHLAEQAGVLRLLQARENGELAHHLQGAGRAFGGAQRRLADKFLVNPHLFADAQAIRHLDDVDAVQERFVVLVVAKRLPFTFIAVRQNDTVKRNGAEAFRAFVIALLRGGEQRVQHLDGRFEHLYKLQQALVGQAQAAGIAVGVGVVLGKSFELADVYLAHKRADVLVVLVARLGFGHANLLEHAGETFDDAELADVAAKFVEPLDGPGRQHALQVTRRNAVIFPQDGAVFERVEQPQRRLVHR